MSSDSDLTARARIRDAAITLFAERGIAGATIRDIAQAAGVSSGLLRHHFGSKDGLRDACDEWAMSRVSELQLRFAETQVVGALPPDTMSLQRYLVRSLMDGSPTGMKMFAESVDRGGLWLERTGIDSADPRAFVAVLAAMKMGMFLMHEQLSDVLGEDVSLMPGWLRMVRASVEIFRQPLLTPEQADQARQALDRLALHEGESHHGRGD
ncbi:TetR family transcriptional regulator [Actinoplanes ianthinogenes]|uniref:TetR family transcriptional regulator n=1 Tax=Actinoplanes ianthinogenes TaxID=122358 RepID=A0ABN6CIQ1_9ACTN|nr:TetR/AcrR family transcriptional regulator [Actinoplanes ianthinogenes]BCJ44073.1 TetR family transcriptional regulator [Actinoplanes ianthinogenes]GGQ95592.1 TetR family transcriptional regulator [Actinoplanes ianthinogenes]